MYDEGQRAKIKEGAQRILDDLRGRGPIAQRLEHNMQTPAQRAFMAAAHEPAISGQAWAASMSAKLLELGRERGYADQVIAEEMLVAGMGAMLGIPVEDARAKMRATFVDEVQRVAAAMPTSGSA